MTAKRNRIFRKRKLELFLLLALFYIFVPQKTYAAGYEVADARKGIIEVQSGFTDAKDNFREMKSGSGFLIRNEQNETYIITNHTVVANSVSEMKKYCKKKKIDTEKINLSNEIRIVVKGDVTVSASVLVKSVEQDYCILSTDDVLHEKQALKLGSSKEVRQGENVYALGFPKEAEHMEYAPADVEIKYGTVIDEKAKIRPGVFLRHSIPVSAGNTGGPLMNEKGYVIGLTCRKFTDKKKERYYAAPVDEIIEVLNSIYIYFGSETIDTAYEKLDRMYQTCLEISAESGYTKDSAQAFTLAVQEAQKTLEKETPVEEELTTAYRALAAAKVRLVPKMTKLELALRIFAVCDGILFLWFVIIFVKNSNEKKRMYRPQKPFYPTGSRGQENRPVLFFEKTGETAVVDKSRFVIGADPLAADYCLAGNPAVSGEHAVLFENNDNWYIDDRGSLNGTFVNQVRVMPGTAVMIRDGDTIVLADEVCQMRR